MPENQKFKELLEKAKNAKTSTSQSTSDKLSTKNKVVTTSKSAETSSKEKVLATHQAYNTAVDTKGLSKTQKVTIATALGLAVVTAVAVPVSIHLINSNKAFDITISSNYNMESTEHESVTVKPGTLISELTPIAREGFVFKGWYKDSACTELYPLDYEIKEDDVVYALLEVEVVDISLTVNINGTEHNINTQSGKTIEQALEENNIILDDIVVEGHHLLGLYKDPLGEKQYPNGYILKKNDTSIYALYEINTYLITFPSTQEGYYILDTAGNPITSTQRVTYGQDFSFKVFIADGYFDNGLKVFANTQQQDSSNETYTFTSIGSNFNIEIQGIKKIEDVYFTLVVNGNPTTYGTSSQMTLREFFTEANLPYTEETTAGIFTNSELTESISFDTTIDKDATYYINLATTQLLTFTLLEDDTYSVSALNYDITGDVVIPAYYNGKPVTVIADYAFVNIEETDEETGLPLTVQISSIVLPSTLTSVGEYSFAFVPITIVNIPEGVKTISAGAFGMSNIAYITLPNSLVEIREYAFTGCTALTEIHIPNSVVSIGSCVFYECTNLTIYCLDFAGRPLTWDKDWNESNCPVVWDESRRFSTDSWIGRFNGNEAILDKYTGTSVDIVIPKEINGKLVKRIDDGLFENNDIIESIYVPSTIEYVETYSYQYSQTNYGWGSILTRMSKLENIYFEGSKSEWNNSWSESTSHTMGGGTSSSNKHVIYNVKEVRQNEKWKYVVHNNDTITLVKYIGGKQHVIVPVSIDGMNVTTLNYKFLDSNITKVCLYKVYEITEYNYTSGMGARSYYYPFTGCSNLTIYLSYSDYSQYIATTGWNKYSDTANCPVSIIPGYDYDSVTADWDV